MRMKRQPQKRPASLDVGADEIIPPIRLLAPWRVKELNVVAPFQLSVAFMDGVAGIVDMTELVHSPSAGVFAALADPTLFAQAFVLYGAVTWPGGLDLAPDAMYDAFTTKGEWVLR